MNESEPNADTPEKASSLHEVDGRVTLESIARLAIEAHDATERYCAHAEDAEGCGYANDPTGSLHVADSYNRMSERAEQLRTAIEAFKLQAPIGALCDGDEPPQTLKSKQS